jgi:hypothetical protein
MVSLAKDGPRAGFVALGDGGWWLKSRGRGRAWEAGG